MTDDRNQMRDDVDMIDTQLHDDDMLCNLFSAFDEVTASDELQSATLAAIFASADASDTADAGAGAGAGDAADAADVADDADDADENQPSLPNTISPYDGAPENIASSPSQPLANITHPEVRAVAGGNQSRAARRAKWRAIRVVAIAACLALTLTGGVAYATPVSYYDVTQGESTVTLGVNCFGLTISATSNDEEGTAVIESTDLRNVPYAEAMERTVEQMEQRNPDAAVEFGPQGGEHETVPPRNEAHAGAGAGAPQPENTGPASGEDVGEGAGAGAPASVGAPASQPEDASPDGEPDANPGNGGNQTQDSGQPDRPNAANPADRR